MHYRQVIPRRTWFISLLGCLSLCLLPACQPVPAKPILAFTETPTLLVSPATQTVAPATSVPSLEPEETICHEDEGLVRREMLETDILPGQLFYSIYLPPCYTDEKEYPSIYLLHGLSFKDDQWIRLGITRVADELIRASKIPPIVIVMPYNPNPNRSPESNFGMALTDALIPYVDAHYSTCIETECRSIGGLSRGGGWAFDIFLNHPELFSAVGGHSPALFQRSMERFMDKLTNVWSGQRVWLDVGEMDQEKNYLVGIDSALTAAGIPHIFILGSGEHDEIYWKAHVEEYLLWYAGDSE